MTAMVDVSTISEDDALTLVRHLHDRFGWAAIVFTRQDAGTYLLDDPDGLTDGEWESVRSSYAWRKFDDWANDGGELLAAALASDAGDVIAARANAGVTA